MSFELFTVHGLDLHQLDFQKPPDLSHLLSSGSPREPLPSCSLFSLSLSHPLPASPPPHFAAPFPHSSSCWFSPFFYPLPSCSPAPPHKTLQINPILPLSCFNPFKALPPKPGGNPNFWLWPGPLPTSPALFNSQNSTTSFPPHILGSHSALCPGRRYLCPPTCLSTVCTAVPFCLSALSHKAISKRPSQAALPEWALPSLSTTVFVDTLSVCLSVPLKRSQPADLTTVSLRQTTELADTSTLC